MSLLISLFLQGPPGVGKTSTAETLALATRKPLFSVGVADVGTEAKHAEANLSKIFDLASSWQAILLMWVPRVMPQWPQLASSYFN